MLSRGLIAAAFLGACSSCHDIAPDAAQSTGVDSAVAADSAAVESSVPFETGGLGDSSIDAPPDSPLAIGSWAGVSVVPECPPSIALNPAMAVPPLSWTACPGGRTGCRTLVVDWSSRTDLGPFQRSYPSVHLVDGRTYFMHRRRSAEWNLGVVEDGFDGDVVAATAFSPTQPVFCSFNVVAGKTGLALLGLVGGKEHSATLDSKAIVGFAPWSSLAKPSFRLASHAEFGATTESGGVVSLIPGEKTGFAVTYMPNAVQPFDLALLKPTRAYNVSGYPAMVPDGALTSDLLTFDLLLVRDDGSHVVWTSPERWDSGKRVISWHDFDQTTRTDVAWIECTLSSDITRDCELWTAAYAGDPAKIVRRRLGPLPPTLPAAGRGMILNAGVVLVVTGKTAAAIYRLADGQGWAVNAEPGTEFAEPVWVSGEEAIVSTAKPGEKPSGMLRIRRDSLGSPGLKL